MNKEADERAIAARGFRALRARRAEYEAARIADAEAARLAREAGSREVAENYTRANWRAIAFTAIVAVGCLLLVERMVLGHQAETCLSEHRPNCEDVVTTSFWSWLW